MAETPGADQRVFPPFLGDTRAQVAGFIDFMRDVVVRKASGLSEADAHRAVLPSPLMTVTGLLSHLRWVEAHWFGTVLEGEPDRAPYTDEDPDADFRAGEALTLEQAIAEYTAQCAVSREIAARHDDDEVLPFRDGGQVTVRWVLLHMVEETARHVGHLDVIRESLDGATGV
ncbi:DinB family protein [Actinokineospora sp. G85]|uniref:DinB family protein n=1 Tax=Actinokineospora sp. G85 TaxID=3406626 RepID=UPI003C74F5D5